MVDLFLNQTDFSCSDQAYRNLFSQSVQLYCSTRLMHWSFHFLETWVQVLMQVTLHLSLMLIFICPHLQAVTSLHNGRIWRRSKTSWGRAESGSECFGVVVWQLCKVQVHVGTRHFSFLITSCDWLRSWCSWALAGRSSEGVGFARLVYWLFRIFSVKLLTYHFWL